MKIWLDDERPAPKEFIRVESAFGLIMLLKEAKERPKVIDFDYYLGAGMTGLDALVFIAERMPEKYPEEVRAHSADEEKSKAILAFDREVRAGRE